MRCPRTPRTLVALALAVAPTVACGQDAGARSEGAASLYRQGKYAEAITAAGRSVGSDSASADGVVLVRALGEVGRWRDAIRTGQQLMRHHRGTALPLAVADALRTVGDDAGAAQVLGAAAGQGPDSLMVRYELAVLAFDRGEHARAMEAFDAFIDVYNENRARLRAGDFRAVALAVRRLGRRDPQMFKDALRAFDQAIAADSMDLEPRLELADMLLEKFNYPEARATLASVVRVNATHPRALLLQARLDAAEGRSTGPDLVAGSLEVNPASPEAHAMAAMQLVDVERYREAEQAARQGLVVDSGAPAPWIAIAAARLLAGDRAGHTAALARAHARLAGSARAEVMLADVMARNRLYTEAAALAAQGVARDSLNPRALALLGINEMRIGRVDEGRAHLTRAFALDPYDVWVKNTLDLLDTFANYTELRTPRFTILAETKDAPLLELFVGPLAEEAYDSLAARYAFKPALPVRVEMFRSSADFSVRAVGLGGLGALGVSFGGVVAMDSPAARKVGEFNWGSTLWHELTHTFTLGVTANRVPRWVSEGLSVYEERRARTGWGADATPSLVAAWKAGQLRPVSQLNNGFLRPRYPEEVGLSYALASYVCEMVEAEYGIAGIRRFLQAFREGKSANEAFEIVAGTGIAAFDAKFDAWFRRRFAREFDAVDPVTRGSGRGAEGGLVKWEGTLFAAMRRATTAIGGKQWDVAQRELESAKALFPSWAEEGSPYHLLAELHLVRGDTVAAIRELREVVGRNESAFAEGVQLAGLLRQRGDTSGSVAALDRTLFITPFDATVHESLASLAGAQGQHARAVRSRRALVALNPSDRAEALYQLARALAAAGDVAGARREVLRALDLAPNFEKAQELLLSLRTPEARR